MEYISSAALAITGHTPQAFYEDPRLTLDAVHPDDRVKAIAMRRHPEKFSEPVVLRWVHPDGRIVCVEPHNTPVFNSAGALVALKAWGGT